MWSQSGSSRRAGRLVGLLAFRLASLEMASANSIVAVAAVQRMAAARMLVESTSAAGLAWAVTSAADTAAASAAGTAAASAVDTAAASIAGTAVALVAALAAASVAALAVSTAAASVAGTAARKVAA